MRMRHQTTTGQDMDWPSMSFSPQSQNLINHRQARPQNADAIPGFNFGQPSRLPAVANDTLRPLFFPCDSLHRQTRSADTETQNDILRAQLLTIFQRKRKSACAIRPTGRSLGPNEVHPGPLLPASKQAGQPVAKIKTIITARGEQQGIVRHPVFRQPVNKVIRSVREDTHSPGRHIQTMIGQFRAIGGAAPEIRLIADDSNRGFRRQGR
ncbi:hypothetical protein H009_01899 [Agrobacterium tumefaciens str. Cherry 2E-2-2]|nr:hypothetical protein H009_01899 [Agrobacterium tumefaciens str. Cherry 2E-2-2]